MDNQIQYNSDNKNILCRFFETVGRFWQEAARFDLFILLIAIGLLVVLFLTQTLSDGKADVVMNMIIFCAIAVGSFVLFKIKGTNLAAFSFAAALLIRFILVFVLESSQPHMLEGIRGRAEPWVKHYDSVLFLLDEYYYYYYAQGYENTTTTEFINSPQFIENADRASFFLSRIFNFFGEQSIWPRVIGAFSGAISAGLIALAAQALFRKQTANIIAMLAAMAPQMAFCSVRFLKETWIVFAVAVMVFGLTFLIRNRKIFLAISAIAIATIMLFWFRFEYGVVFVAFAPMVLFFKHKSNFAGKIIATITIILFSIVLLTGHFERLANKAEKLFDKYSITERNYENKLAKIEIIDAIHKSRGPARILNIPLVVLNPPPRNLHHIYTEEKKLYDVIVLSDIYQWWLPLPFLIIGAITIISKKTEFLPLLLPYLIATSVSALLLGAFEGDTLRYRDSLAPVAFIIVGIGIENFMALPKNWKTNIAIAVYAGFILCAVCVQIIVYS